ncbi:MAG: TIGR03084 family metal-binding protein [Pseudomonadota bacterium]
MSSPPLQANAPASGLADEAQKLNALLSDLREADFARVTKFKAWTANDILAHLYTWDKAALMTLNDPPLFRQFMGDVMQAMQQPNGWRRFEHETAAVQGHDLRLRWLEQSQMVDDRYGKADPKARVEWAGPSMSVRSSVTARLMELWSHAQALYDLFGITRQDGDALKNIAQLGINTFGWTFKNRGLPVPEIRPYVLLVSPSGAEWSWPTESPSSQDMIKGSATEFCQVVTQTRNIADTSLVVDGDVAETWMAIAQCFAGPPHDPPAPGSRGPE